MTKGTLMKSLFALAVSVGLVSCGIAVGLRAQTTAPPPTLVAGGFCTYPTGYFKNRTDGARRINQYLATGAVGSEIFHIGVAPHVYTWLKTGTTTWIGKGKDAVQVDQAVAALFEAMGTVGSPSAFSQNATNPTDMGTAGVLATEALALKINQSFSEVFVTPATGFSGLTLVDMDSVLLDGQSLTPAQAAALNGQATLQVREAVDAALGGAPGPLPYGLTFAQLADLLDLLNGSFEDCVASAFAQAHLYQPYVTSDAFPGQQRPSTVSIFAYKPTYESFSGNVVYVGRGCPAGSVTSTSPEDPYLADATGKIALIQRGGCRFDAKVAQAQLKGATAAIVFNNAPGTGCPATPTPGSNQCEALLGMAGSNPVVLTTGTVSITIPAAFIQRSTGLALSAAPVAAFGQQ